MTWLLGGIAWWWYPLGIIIAILIGACFAAVGYFVYSRWTSYKIRKGTPIAIPLIGSAKGKIDRANVSEWIKDENTVRTLTLDAGNVPKLTEKEVIEDDREKSAKYREFEKLRRAAQAKSGTGGIEANSKQPERSNIQDKSFGSNTKSDNSSKRSIRFD